jgi:Xaa-Pro aminopeptidase
MTPTDRLAALRAQLTTDHLDGFVIPLTDEHMSEYVGGYAQRLGWLTGFGGSAGTAVVLADRAAIFTDGRYTIQVREQVDGAHWAYEPVPQTSPAAWLGTHAPEGGRIGYDPWLHTGTWVADTTSALAERGATLVAVDANPIDAIWTDRPAPSPAKLTVQPDQFTGASSAEKRAKIADWLSEHEADAVILSALDSIAWALNVRGDDVDHTPVALSYAIVGADGTTDLFVAPDKLDDTVRQHLGNAVRLHDRTAFAAALATYAGKRVAADPERAVAAITQALQAGGAKILPLRDPVVLAKAIKNSVEIAGHRAASARDGAALARFLRWVEIECVKGGQTELSAAAKLLAFREQTGVLKDTSFNTISATGPHGAIPHYHVTEESSAPIQLGQLYLIDSGGQYSDGTTDVTRVMPIGEPTEEMRDRFTRVLKGHIAIATAVFPDRRLRPPSLMGSRPRFRARHRPRHRRLSRRPRRPPAHRRPQLPRRCGDGAPASRHDALQRARLLQGRRIRHPHREPDPDRAPRHPWCGPRDARLRNAHLLPDRTHADRTDAADRRRTRLGRRLSCEGAGGPDPRNDRRRRPRMAHRQMRATQLEGSSFDAGAALIARACVFRRRKFSRSAAAIRSAFSAAFRSRSSINTPYIGPRCLDNHPALVS